MILTGVSRNLCLTSLYEIYLPWFNSECYIEGVTGKQKASYFWNFLMYIEMFHFLKNGVRYKVRNINIQ